VRPITSREEPFISTSVAGAGGGPERKSVAEGRPPASAGDDLIELLFFAYRDFVGDPDRILADYGFGRAHHRVLHFVDRYPGLTIAELLDILRITKQSLNRVLKDLIGQGYVVQRPGTSDRRQRLLSCTPAGEALAADLTRVQARRLARALATPDAAASPEDFLMAMIEPEDRPAVRRLMARRSTRQGGGEGR
jgi:DNA-binding MarR family transcriptional regulator